MENLWKELEKYSASNYYPFHMPGHKRLPKEEAPACDKRLLLEDIYPYDITEIEGFDNLHDAKGLLLSLQQKAARIYHAEQSFFLVNGSTGGILSAVSAVAQEKKKLLVARNCHKSVYNAILLNRMQAEYVWPETIEEFDIQGEIRAEEIERRLCGRQDICGVVITSPTYDGILSDIHKIAETVHACHMPLIVDEAHGAHFALSEKAPRSAVECGADLVINSTHKTLPALTQTALLHVQGKLVDREKLRSYLHIYQTSSPSYLLMASIDSCVDFIEKKGMESYEKLLKLREEIDRSAAEFSCIRILPFCERRDPGKLVISVKNTDMTGQELYQILLQKYHLQMEMWAPAYVLGILTGMDTKEGVKRLLCALREIDRSLARREKRGTGGEFKAQTECKPPQAMQENTGEEGIKYKEDIYTVRPQTSGLTIYEAVGSKKEWTALQDAAGRISGGFLYFYPPGIPLLVPGEIISDRQISKIEKCREREEYLTGISEDGKVCVLAERMGVQPRKQRFEGSPGNPPDFPGNFP